MRVGVIGALVASLMFWGCGPSAPEDSKTLPSTSSAKEAPKKKRARKPKKGPEDHAKAEKLPPSTAKADADKDNESPSSESAKAEGVAEPSVRQQLTGHWRPDLVRTMDADPNMGLAMAFLPKMRVEFTATEYRNRFDKLAYTVVRETSTLLHFSTVLNGKKSERIATLISPNTITLSGVGPKANTVYLNRKMPGDLDPEELPDGGAVPAKVSAGTIDWVALPAGRFQMGSKKHGPIHPVSLGAFKMSRTETTMLQYSKCVTAGSCETPDIVGFSTGAMKSTRLRLCNWGKKGREHHPINCIGVDEARAFCLWKGGRLPTEAEWEYAARGGGQAVLYPWGDDTPTCKRVVMAEGCGKDRTWTVCAKPLGNTPRGLCDMAGNVAEWVHDVYEKDYYAKSPEKNPRGPEKGYFNAARGGHYTKTQLEIDELSATHRGGGLNTFLVGFRCVR